MEALKARLKQLMGLREAMEREIEERLARLDAPGGAGRTGSLVDSEGYPRSDIDIYAVREDRNRVAVLTNDHKAITDQIQEALHALHEHTRNAMEVDSEAQPSASKDPTERGEYFAFAYVDSVSPDSPASEAGIEIGDELCQFGKIFGQPAHNEGIFPRLSAALRAAEGQSVETVFLRRGEIRRLQLTPKKWGGPGLIGCHLRPLAARESGTR